MTALIRDVGRESRDALLPLMEGLQAVELSMEPNRVPPDEIAPHLDHLLDMVEKRGGVVLLAEDAGAPVGFLIGVCTEEDGLYTLAENRALGAVTDLFVAPEARRQGLASRLLAEAETRFKALGRARMDIGALAANGPARALYLRWAGAEGAVLYGKSLRDP